MKAFTLPFDTLLLRFYLMMALVILAGFSGIWAIAFLAIPVFLTCLLGLRFVSARREQKQIREEQQSSVSLGVRHTATHQQHAA